MRPFWIELTAIIVCVFIFVAALIYATCTLKRNWLNRTFNTNYTNANVLFNHYPPHQCPHCKLPFSALEH